MKSVVVDLAAYDWEGDRPLDRPFAETVIYEAHVRGFTANPNSGVDPALPRHLRRVHREDPVPRRPRRHGGRAAAGVPVRRPGRARRPAQLLGLPAGVVLRPARRLQQPARRAGRGRRVPGPGQGAPPGGPRGHPRRRLQPHGRGRRRTGRRSPTAASPTTSTTSLDPPDRSRYADYSGCGNTLNANEPVVRRLILDSLRYWVAEMHVDGFRFDLASVLSRDEDGDPVPRPPIIWDIETDPVLAGTKLIAEAWDAAGLYQVGIVRRRPLDRVERPVPRRRPVVRQERSGQGVGGRPAPAGLARTSTRTSGASPRRRSTSSPATTASRSTTSSPTTASTTRRTARTTATATTHNVQLERRRRGADRRPGDRGAPRRARSGTSWRSSCSRSASRC